MKWIIGAFAGLVLGGLVIGALSLGESAGRTATAAAGRLPAPTAPQASGGTPDTSVAERAGCDWYRTVGVTGTIGDWVNIAVMLRGTRLGEEGAAVERAAAAGGSRATVYGAVLDVFEGCLRVGA